MDIIKYQPAFREQCIAIFESNQHRFFAPEERTLFIDWLDHHTAADYYVVELNGEITACGGIFFDNPSKEAGLSWGMVHAAYHKQGIGKEFTLYRIALIRSKFPGAVVRIETSQHTVAFYEKLGFTTVDVIVDGFGKGLDQYNMRYDPANTHE